jgi:hypothetical protein
VQSYNGITFSLIFSDAACTTPVAVTTGNGQATCPAGWPAEVASPNAGALLSYIQVQRPTTGCASSGMGYPVTLVNAVDVVTPGAAFSGTCPTPNPSLFVNGGCTTVPSTWCTMWAGWEATRVDPTTLVSATIQ